MSLTKVTQLLEEDGCYMLVTTTINDGVQNTTTEIVADTEEAYSEACDKVCGFGLSIFGSKKPDES